MDKVVYLHRRKTNGKVFYVGMGSLKRALHKHGRAVREKLKQRR